MVAHGGTSVAGSFIQTLTMVDVATGWTECLPLIARDGGLVVEAIKRAQSLFPWLLRGADFDNDSTFMNDVVVPWCRAQKIEVTRSRAYKKNDQAFVEQKNGAVVRRLVGYGRLEGVEAAQAMARLYAAARLYVNFFQPSFKLKEKRREGAKVIKRQSSELKATLVRSAAFFLFASAYLALLPLIARNQLAAGASGFGILFAGHGAGAVLRGVAGDHVDPDAVGPGGSSVMGQGQRACRRTNGPERSDHTRQPAVGRACGSHRNTGHPGHRSWRIDRR
jgi:hypothetical protein